MLRDFDDAAAQHDAPEGVLDDVLESAANKRYLIWRDRWERNLIKRGWIRSIDLPKKLRKRLLTANGFDEYDVDLVNPEKSQFVTLYSKSFCPCCTTAAIELKRRGYDATAIFHGDEQSGGITLSSGNQLKVTLPFDSLVLCFASSGIFDFRGSPYQMRKDAYIPDGCFDPVNDADILALFSSK